MYNWTVMFRGTRNVACQCAAKSAKEAKRFAMELHHLSSDSYLIAHKVKQLWG